jgi:uncharacterized protein
MTGKLVFDPKIASAIETGDCATLRRLIQDNPKHINARTPFAGGTWLHYAASMGRVEVAQALLDLGFEVNQAGYMEGYMALCRAAGRGHVKMLHFLIDEGGAFDTSASVRNALFAAIVNKSSEAVRALLVRGFDAKPRYNSDTMIDLDATAFALWRGEQDIAVIIALHLANGEETRAQSLLSEAADVVERNAPLEWVRIVPAIEDLNDRIRRDRAELTRRSRAAALECAGHSEKMSDGARWRIPDCAIAR